MIKCSHNSILLMVILLYTASIANGQNKYSEEEEVSPFERTFIKLSPLALLQVEPSLMIGVEYSVNSRFRIQHEIGYISLFNPFYYVFRNDINTVVNSSGFRVSSAIKIPISSETINTKYTYSYYGMDVMFKYLYVNEPDAVVSRQGGAYTQVMEVSTYKYVGTINVIYGINHYFNSKKTNVLDWWIGVGFRYKYINGDLPPDADIDNYIPVYDQLDGLIMGLTGGVKVGIGI